MGISEKCTNLNLVTYYMMILSTQKEKKEIRAIIMQCRRGG